MEFTKSAGQILSSMKTSSPHELSSSLEAAKQVAGCSYEYGTLWGREVRFILLFFLLLVNHYNESIYNSTSTWIDKATTHFRSNYTFFCLYIITLTLITILQVGWIYGSTTEDVLTGLTIHGRGWKSAYCSPNPPAFLGCAPSGGPAIMTQQKRWTTGLLEILFSRRSPFFLALQGKLQFRQCLAYLWLMLWGLRSIPELCYAILPAYCIVTSSHFLPKVSANANHHILV